MAVARVPVLIDTPDATGSAYPTLSTSNGFSNIRRLVPAFAKDIDSAWEGVVQVPQGFASGGKIVLSIAANATTGVTRLIASTAPMADGEQLDTAYTAETAQDITVPGTAKLRKDVTFTLTSSPAVGDAMAVKVTHNGAHANDTLAVDTLLWQVHFEYTTV